VIDPDRFTTDHRPMSSSRRLSALGASLRDQVPWLYLALRKAAHLGRKEALDLTWERIASGLSPNDLAVQAGPFAGMRYLPFSGGSGLLPKIVGSYEMELHAAVAESISRRPARLINIGASEGYYAVGYARRLPELEVYAFDINALARRRLRKLARRNGVLGRTRSRRECTHAQLEDLIVDRTVIICDCEGCEGDLLDPRRAPRLSTADLLVELHVERNPAVTPSMLSRFGSTHLATRVVMASRDHACTTFAGVLSRIAPEDRGMAVHERVERTEWLWLRCISWPGSASP
jgi:hypothetical protein